MRFLGTFIVAIAICGNLQAAPELTALPSSEPTTIDFKKHDLIVELMFAEQGQQNLRLNYDLHGNFKVRFDFYVGPYVNSKPFSVLVPIGDISSDDVFPFWNIKIRVEHELLSYMSSPRNSEYFGPNKATTQLNITAKIYLVLEASNIFVPRDDVAAISTFNINNVPLDGRALPGFSDILIGLIRPIDRANFHPLIPEAVPVLSIDSLLSDRDED